MMLGRQAVLHLALVEVARVSTAFEGCNLGIWRKTWG